MDQGAFSVIVKSLQSTSSVSAPDHLVTLLVPQLGVDDAALEPLLTGQRGPVRVLVAVVAHAAEQHVAGEHQTWSSVNSEGSSHVCQQTFAKIHRARRRPLQQPSPC